MIQDANLNSPQLLRMQQRAFMTGIFALLLCGAGALADPTQFFHSYLFAFIYWSGIPIGALAVIMLHHLSGGAWGLVIRRILEAATRTLPIIVLLFVPIVLGMKNLYEWARPDLVQSDRVLQEKALYLNVPFFLIRSAFYFLAWFLLSRRLNHWSRIQDQTGDPALASRMETLSGPGLVLFGATVTFASFDWVMSLEPHWYSTVFGLSFMVGQVLTSFPFAIGFAVLLSRQRPMSEVISPSHFQDLGKLTLAFVMLWAYLAFSQFLIIWSANLPEETQYYVKRLHGGWQFLQLSLIVLHFALPFILLLSRSIKRSASKIAKVVIIILLTRFIDIYLQILPAGHHAQLHLHWMDIVAPIGVGGIWISYYIRQLVARPLLPLRDASFEEVLEGGH